MAINLVCLEAFLSVAEEGSFTASAKALGLGQSVLSERIKKLERYVGLRLIQRTTRRVELSRAGKRFLPHAISLMAQARKIEEISAALVKAENQILSIGAGPYAGSQRKMLIDQFKRKYPHIDVQLTISTSQTDLLKKLHDGELDLIIGWGSNDCAAHDQVPCYKSTVGLVVPTGGYIEYKDSVTRTDLAGREIVTCAPDLYADFHQHLLKFAAERDIKVIVAPEVEADEIMAFARGRKLPNVACREFGTSKWPIDGYRYVKWQDFAFAIEYQMIRNPFYASRAANAFWQETQMHTRLASAAVSASHSRIVSH